MKNEIYIIGAGLTGPLLSSTLSRKYNFKVNMFERSSDSRILNNFSGRSINLALSKRGVNALKYAEIYNDEFKSQLIPMYGRTIHSKDGNIKFHPYGNKKDHYINSVSRAYINQILINHAEKSNNVKLHFDMECNKVDLVHNRLYFLKKNVEILCPIIGADGYKSAVAKNITNLNKKKLEYINIEHSYKELTIPSKNNEYQLEPNSLHIWPRRDLMMIALPNIDKSFTCTLFMKSNGENSFDKINTKERLYSFFEQNFNNALNLIPNLESDFFNNPTGSLIGLRVPKWYYQDKALVIGDAAHATVPFYGQGMNAAFEDCEIFSKSINDFKSDSWEDAFKYFYQLRKDNADALLELSLENYMVMRNDVLDDLYIKKQKLSFLLNKDFPQQFIPLYTMVSFTTIPYKVCLERGKVQDKILNKLINIENIVDYDKILATNLINKYLSKIIYN